MTQIDVTQPILNIDGTPMEEPAICQGCKEVIKRTVLTLRLVCTSASIFLTNNEQPLEGAENIKRLHLGLRIQAEDNPDLSIEDLALLKDRIRLKFTPLIAARAWLMLDPPKKE